MENKNWNEFDEGLRLIVWRMARDYNEDEEILNDNVVRFCEDHLEGVRIDCFASFGKRWINIPVVIETHLEISGLSFDGIVRVYNDHIEYDVRRDGTFEEGIRADPIKRWKFSMQLSTTAQKFVKAIYDLYDPVKKTNIRG